MVLVDLVSQWQPSPRVRRDGRPRGPRWGLALWLGLGLGLGAAACLPRKDHECATVQARVLEEVRVVDGFHDHLQDAKSIIHHTRRLREVSAGLRSLDIQDAGLRLAVERYHTSIDQLAEAWSQVAEARQREHTDAGSDAGSAADRLVRLGALMSARAIVVNGARTGISEACGAR